MLTVTLRLIRTLRRTRSLGRVKCPTVADLMQVFENELGLYISENWFVTPVAFKSDAEYDELKRRYLQVCDRAGLECAVSDGWTLDTRLGRRFSEEEAETSDKILLTEDHLLTRYDEWDGGEPVLRDVQDIPQNLFFALVYNAAGVPVAAGVLFPFFSILISPIFAAAAMSLSSVSVVGNALRLRSVKI